MKQLSKIMLAAVASVALAAPAFAWDFSASGSSSATFKHETINSGASGAKDDINNAFSSSAGGVSVTSSHTDGGNSATFTYTADWNGDAGNFDESVAVSGSKKVGNWTASSGTTQHIQKDVGPGNCKTCDQDMAFASPMTSGNTALITLTDGSITYKLGDAGHLGTAEKAVNGPMDGAVDAEARVDSFNGFSVGLAVGPGTLTVALDENNGTATTMLGDIALTVACGANAVGFGVNFSGDVGADLSFTYASGSATASVEACTAEADKSDKASASTMGLGVAVPIGGMSLAIDYESSAQNITDNSTETKGTQAGYELSFTMPIADATVGVNVSSQELGVTEGTADKAVTTTAGTELWYSVPIGAVTLAVGYGSQGITTGSDTKVTKTTNQMGAEMSMSF